MSAPAHDHRIRLGGALRGCRLDGFGTPGRADAPGARPAPVSVAAAAPPPAQTTRVPPEEDPALRRAFQEAEARGRAAAETTWRVRLGSALRGLEDAAHRLGSLTGNALAEIEDEACALAVAIAEKVLRTELTEGRQRIEVVVADAFHAARERLAADPLRLRLHPEDVVSLTEAAGPELRRALEHVELAAAPGLGRGDVEVDTRAGELFAGATEELRQVRVRLLEASADGGGEMRL